MTDVFRAVITSFTLVRTSYIKIGRGFPRSYSVTRISTYVLCSHLSIYMQLTGHFHEVASVAERLKTRSLNWKSLEGKIPRDTCR